MKPRTLLFLGSISMAAWMSTGLALAQSSGSSKRDTVHPNVGPGGSEGGSQSERTGESGVPLPKGSPYSGTVTKDKSQAGRLDSSGSTAMRGNMSNVKEVQQALKDKGYNPGPVDGVMGARTKEALKSFQSASNLQVTGTLNAETAEKLGVRANASSSNETSDSMGSRSRSKSTGDTSIGTKDSDRETQKNK